MRYSKIAVGILLLFAIPGLAQAETWTIDTPHTRAQFAVRHMMISTVRGEFTKVTGTVDLDETNMANSRVEATIDTTTLSTGVPQRDGHVKSADFLDVANHPAITFTSKSVEKAADGKLRVAGDLTLRGVTRPVVLDVDALSPSVKDKQGNLHAGTAATTKINRKDFGVNFNAVMDGGGLVVGDEVTITIDVELVKKAGASQ